MPGFAVRRLWISAAVGLLLMVVLTSYRYATVDVAPPEPTADVCALVGSDLLTRAVSSATPQRARVDRSAATLVNACELADGDRFLQATVWHFGREDGRSPVDRARRDAHFGPYIVALQPTAVRLGDESYEDGDERTAHVRVRLGATVIAVELQRESDALVTARLIAQRVAARCGC